MEDVLMIWSSEASPLETLQPLTFSALDDHEESINLDKLSRSEIAGKLLDHLDHIAERQETEPFDWFANEKTIDLPIFENISSSIAVAVQNNNSEAGTQSSHYSYFDSPEYEPTFAPTNYVFEGSTVAGTTQPQLTYVAPVNAGPTMLTTANTFVPPEGIPASPQFVDCDPKKEVLTPPDSPKDAEEILRLLREIEPEDWENFVFDERPGNVSTTAVAPTTSSVTSATSISTTIAAAAAISPTAETNVMLSENSYPVDDLSDYAASSPYVCSESSSDNDADYVPRSGADRRASSSSGGSGDRVVAAGGRRRASKPYSRHSAEERRLRKKEQNKNAATRYRMKKKQEVEESKNEEQRLADRNRELRNKLDDISREIKCLKSLMRDVYRKKGFIK